MKSEANGSRARMAARRPAPRYIDDITWFRPAALTAIARLRRIPIDYDPHVIAPPNSEIRDVAGDFPARCPRCDYIVAGLPQPRCPECGGEFAWDDAIRRAAQPPPAIAFERARGGLAGVGGFAVTWLTVLFAPWIFAQQALTRVDLRRAILFAGLCFASTWLSMLNWMTGSGGPDVAFMITWNFAAAVQIVAQSLLLLGLDAPHWSQPRRSLIFWLAIGGYTSAVMSAEIRYGPPPLEWNMLTSFFSKRGGGFISPFQFSEHGLQTVLWLIGLGVILFARLRSGGLRIFTAIGVALVGAALVFLVAIGVVQFVGWPLGAWLDQVL